MTITDAIRIVLADQAAGDITDPREALEHVFDTLLLPGEPGVAGGHHVEVDGPDDEVGNAYVTVLETAQPGDSPEGSAARLLPLIES